jgi:hypothetical protein
MGGIQKIALFGKRQSPYYGKNSSNIKEKRQSIITLDMMVSQYGKFFQVQLQNPSSVMMKLSLMRNATGKEEPEIAAQIDASQSSSNRHISTSTVQRRLHESGLHGRIAVKKPLLKETNNNKRLTWAKKHEQWTLDLWKSVLWSDESKFEIFGSNLCVFVRRSVGEQMISSCVVPTVKHGEGGVMVWGCFAGDTVCVLFRI